MENLTTFGKWVKFRLIDKGKTQNWLIDQITERTGMFCDSSYLNKIMNGSRKPKVIVDAITEILGG